ncbi:hypothetical protein HDV62DRAFT_397854 [Trichoderma sp. SZMC 28011]
MNFFKKSYFLAPTWDLDPSEIALGSVIADITTPQMFISNKDLPTEIDKKIHSWEVKGCSGGIKWLRKGGIGLFTTLLQAIKSYFAISYVSTSSSEFKYTCELIETRTFTLSPQFIAKAAADPAVATFLKTGDKVFIITGVKIAKTLDITTIKVMENSTIVQASAGIPIPDLQIKVEAGRDHGRYHTHTQRIDGPIVFAFQVARLRLNRKNVPTVEDYAGLEIDP